MKAAYKFLGIILFVMLCGCSTTGGILGNLVPLPKFLKGRVENSIYYAKDGSFEVHTPFDEGSYAYTYMAVKEQYSDTGAYVSFYSSTNTNEFYRVEVGRTKDPSQPKPSFPEVVDAIIKGYSEQLKAYGSEPVESWRKETTLDGQRAVLLILIQDVPGRFALQALAKTTPYTTFHIAYIIEAQNGGAVVWVEWPATSGACRACIEGTEEELMSTNDRIKKFFASFKLKI